MLAAILLASVFAPVLAVQDNSASVKAPNAQAEAVHTNLTEIGPGPLVLPYYEGEEGGKVPNDDSRRNDSSLSEEPQTQSVTSAEDAYVLQTSTAPVHDLDVREMMYQALVCTPPEQGRAKSPDELWFYTPQYAIEFCEEILGPEDFKAATYVVTAETVYASYEEQLGVAYEVFNRQRCWKFPETVYDVVYQEGQYYTGTPQIRSGKTARFVTDADVTDSVKMAVAQAYFFPEADPTGGAYFHITPSVMSQEIVDIFFDLYVPCYATGSLQFFTKDFGEKPEDWDGQYEEFSPYANVYWKMAGIDTEDIPNLVETDADGNIIWVDEDYPDKEILNMVIRMVEQDKKQKEEAELAEAAQSPESFKEAAA